MKKEEIFKILYFIWAVILPLFLAGGFGVGIFFWMWKTMQWSLAIIIPVNIIITFLLIFGLGKLIKIW